MRQARFACVLAFALLLACSVLRAEPAVGTIPIPNDAAIKEANAQINDAFSADIAAAKTADLKKALIGKLFAAAKDEKDAGRYALLTRARDLAIEATDIDDCDAAIGELGRFAIDGLKARSDAYTLLARTVRLPADYNKLCQDFSACVESAINADRMDIARADADGELRVARLPMDAALISRAANDVQKARDAQTAFADAQGGMQVLAAHPDDPVANLKVGKYRCFGKNDWKAGLPMLALCSDTALKALASRDIAGAATPDDQIKMGDDWWSIADKLTGAAKMNVEAHAVAWYQDALPAVNGLQKTRMQQRIAKASAATAPAPSVAAAADWINLLQYVDTTRDSVKGHWELQNNTLVSDNAACALINLPYRPPAEYDFRIVFSRNSGDDSIEQICAGAGHQFSLCLGGWNNTVCGFQLINNTKANANQTTRTGKGFFLNGRKYTAVVKVRKDNVQAYIDDTLVAQWKTDYSDMTLPDYMATGQTDTLGLATFSSSTTLYSVEIKEISGKGAAVNK